MITKLFEEVVLNDTNGSSHPYKQIDNLKNKTGNTNGIAFTGTKDDIIDINNRDSIIIH